MSNRKGFSLLEIMAGLGIIGVIAAGMMKVMDSQSKALKTTEARSEQIDLVNRVRTLMSDISICSRTLVGFCSDNQFTSQTSCLRYGESWTNNTNPISNDSTFTEIISKDGNTLLKTPTTFGKGAGGITLTELAITDITTTEGETPANIRLTMQRREGKGNKTIIKYIPIVVSVSGGEIAQCYADDTNTIKTALIRSCENMGGTWNNTNEICSHFLVPLGVCPNPGEKIYGFSISNGKTTILCSP